MFLILELSTKILIILSFVFFLIFVYLCAGWSKAAHPERRFIIGLLVSTLYTFKVLFVAFLTLLVGWVILYYVFGLFS